MPSLPDHGALVISLDFELHWGVRDKRAVTDPYRANLLGARVAVPAILGLLREFDAGATWATVGMLFARDRAELQACSPAVQPAYVDPALTPYDEAVGEDEADDPLHYAPSLIDRIRADPRQEIGTHTFSHYYCLEPGQTAEAFAADLASARRIAADRGIVPRSIVFPRNQHNPAYDRLLREHGITAFRGTQGRWVYDAVGEVGETFPRRLARTIDSYVNLLGHHTIGWDQVMTPSGLANVQASFFLRPASPRRAWLSARQRRRIAAAVAHAARRRRIVHVWWHPHNFGAHLSDNLVNLRHLLEVAARHDLRVMTMGEVADVARGASALRASGVA